MKRLIIVLTTLFLSAILCEQYISAQPDATTSASVQQPVGNANKPEVKAGGQSKGKVDEKAKKKAAKKAKKQLKKKQKKAE